MKVIKLVEGQKFNNWTILKSDESKNSKSYYLCKCSCGVVKSVSAITLRTHKSKSCGCSRKPWVSEVFRRSQIGKTFGRLTILDLGQSKSYYKHYLCKCSCGVVKLIRAGRLHVGHVQSCGCLMPELAAKRFRKKSTNPAFNVTFRVYQTSARNRELEWSLSEEQCEQLFNSNCYYCNNLPSNFAKVRKWEMKYNGIDRIDNTKGYVQNNVVTCCKICNLAKRALSEEEFFRWIERIAKHLKNLGKINLNENF